MDASTTEEARVRLGVLGLPDLTDNLIPGGLYVLIAETAPARFPLLYSNLSNCLNNNIPCCVVLPTNPETFVQRLDASGEANFNQFIQRGELKLFSMQEEFAKKMFQYGAEAFVDELAHYGLTNVPYILFDQADDLLALHDLTLALDRVEVLGKWAQEHHVTVFIVLTRLSPETLTSINGLMDDLTGVARLGVDRNGLELTFDYWQSFEGAVAGRSFLLTPTSTGQYEATAPVLMENAGTGGLVEAAQPEEDPHFFYMDPDLGSLAKQMHGRWLCVDTLVSMLHATRGHRTATCILVFDKSSNLRQLAETVHTLRLTLGRYAQIVVQEKGASLRYQNEALLLKLGLNLVINRDVPANRLPLLIGSLKGQVFSRDVDINFEAALASVLPTRLSGYQKPSRFVREVAEILNRSETLDIPCALMIGRPVANIKMSDIVSNHRISRPGDLMTADDEKCYLFLNACPQAVLLPTLERIFASSLESVLADVHFFVNRPETEAEIAALQRRIERENLPDYSEFSASPHGFEADSETEGTQALTRLMSGNTTAGEVRPPVPVFTSSAVPNKPSEKKSATPSIAKFAAQPATFTRNDESEIKSGQLFEYDGLSNVRVLGKKAVPRATRALPTSRET